MRNMYIGLGFFFPLCESWDSHWDRCYKSIIRCSQFTVCVCFAKGLRLVSQVLGWSLVLPGSYALVEWDVGKEEGDVSERAANWCHARDNRESWGKPWAMRRLEKSREPGLRDNTKTSLETYRRSQRFISTCEKKKRPCHCKDKIYF